MPDVSIVIVNLNQKEFLRGCLRSLTGTRVDAEVIVVDNASGDGSPDMVRSEFPHVRLMRNQTNERFAKPNNDASRTAAGKYLFLLNNDTLVQPEALETLVAYLEQHPEVGMVGPQLRNPDGSIQVSCHKFASLWTHLWDMTALDRLFPALSIFATTEMKYFDHQQEAEVDHLTAAAVVIRAEVFRELGGFDERFSIYYNDMDLSYRLHRSGWRSMFVPQAVVIHFGGSTATPLKRSWEFFREQYENIFLFYRLHRGRGALMIYKMLLFLGFLPRVVLWTLLSLVKHNEAIDGRRDTAVKTIKVLFS